MAESFQGKVFETCLFSLDRDRPFEDRIEEEVEPGFLHVAFDYSDKTPGAAESSVNQKEIAEILRRHFSVRDYRTHEEKKAFAAKVRAKKYAKAGVSTALGYRLYKLKAQLLKLLGRR